MTFLSGLLSKHFAIVLLFLLVQNFLFPQQTRSRLTVPQQYPTIQSAINAAGIGDTVMVSPGIYYENINFSGKPVMVASQYILDGDSTRIIQTVIDGGNNGAVVTFNALETENSLLVGFTLRNGQNAYGGGVSCIDADPVISNLIIKNCDADYGAGIYLYHSNAYLWRIAFTGNNASGSGGAISCDSYSYPALYNLRIMNNNASLGGGLHCYLSSPYLFNFVIEENTAAYGGGIYLYESSPAIWNGIIQQNSSTNYGGGVECDYYSLPTLSYLQINNNVSFYGGGVHLSFSNILLENSTIVSNEADYGAGIYAYYSYPRLENNIVAFNNGSYGFYAYESQPQIMYSNFWENQEGDFFNTGDEIGNLVWVNLNNDSCDTYKNINKVPAFVNPAGNDFHLQSHSRCIDAGNPATQSDPDSSTRDIGKYYFHQSFVANFSCDVSYGLPPLTVQFTDLSTGGPDSWEWDFDGDGVIDSYEQNPVWTFNEMDDYTVSMRCIRGFLMDKRVKPDFIRVFFTPKPGLTSVDDVPGDQGGWVMARFLRSVYDTDTLAERATESYTVQYNSGEEWVSANSTAAYGAAEYMILCHTPFDSAAQDLGLVDFRIIAAMDEGNFLSDVMQGYSVDNIAPQVPDYLSVVLENGDFSLSWAAVPDPDFAYFAIYKSEASGLFGGEPEHFTVDPFWPLTTLETEPLKYAVKAVDQGGNESDFSETVDAPMTVTLEIEAGWSSLSGYVCPANTELEEIFSGLENQLVFLSNLEGYWIPGFSNTTISEWDPQSGYQVKMEAANTVELQGFFIHDQIVQLEQGWNLVPVLSMCPVDVGSLFEIYNDELVVIKDAVGFNLSWPAQEIKTLNYLYPGFAYLFYLSGPATLSFPSCE